MILTRKEILKEIKAGSIRITPFRKELLGPASYDLSLGNTIRVFVQHPDSFEVREDAKLRHLTKLVRIKNKKGYTMKPGEVVLGITSEKISLPPNIAGWLEGRSRFARIGLMVHISSPFIQPGISSRQVLEIANLSPTPLTIFPGTKICQFIFERCEGAAIYHGRFLSQLSP